MFLWLHFFFSKKIFAGAFCLFKEKILNFNNFWLISFFCSVLYIWLLQRRTYPFSLRHYLGDTEPQFALTAAFRSSPLLGLVYHMILFAAVQSHSIKEVNSVAGPSPSGKGSLHLHAVDQLQYSNHLL